MPIDELKMMQSVYDTLFNAYTKTPPGSLPAGSQENKMFMVTIPGGEPVDVEQYANPRTPQNPQGTPAATENFFQLVDRLPLVKTSLSDSGKRVSKIYQDLIGGANVLPQPENPDLKAAYDKAYDLLKDDTTDFDDEGKPIKVPIDSPLYSNYKRKQNAYADAVSGFMAEFSKYDLSKPEDQRIWSVIGPSKQRILTSAWDDLQAAQAKKVEDALATMAQASENQIGRVFKDAQTQLELFKRASLLEPTGSYLPTYALPANWYSSGAAEGWTNITLSSKKQQTNETSNFINYGGKAGYSAGLWRINAEFDQNQEQQHMDSLTENLEVSFKYARINIERPWMNASVFDLPGWIYPPVQKGGFSSGSPATADGTIMTIMPTAFLAVRDLKISADWSAAESDFIRTKLNVSGEFGWGPFTIGGSYKSDSTEKKFKSEFNGGTISAPGLQIMAFICTVLPLCPPA
jgi:hypothetical protein